MNHVLSRRRFLTTTGTAAVGIGLAGSLWARSETQKMADGAPHATKIGWRLGCQAYSFNRFTFVEAIAKNASLGLKVMEAYPGQRLSSDQSDIKIGEAMPAAARDEVKKRLADADIKLVNFGVCGLSKDEAVSRKTFDFAADMGIETLVSEPSFDAFDTLEKLADEYKINVAIHNHPKPSRYWNPDTVLKVCQGRSERIGACADTGHWMRSELNPVEQLKKLEGRIISFHFKDLNKFGRDAHDMPWGTGVGDAKAMLAEIYRQKLQAVFSIEYEYHWDNSLPEIAECVKFFDRAAANIGGTG
jgi:sugar phosphate isomerase/epimerase